MDLDRLYEALGEKKVEGLIRPKIKLLCQVNRENDCREDFTADEHYIFSPEVFLNSIGNSIK